MLNNIFTYDRLQFNTPLKVGGGFIPYPKPGSHPHNVDMRFSVTRNDKKVVVPLVKIGNNPICIL